nr:HTTM domain-containing protein [Pseudenhygromyxa sp. WMMC2535]
MVIYIGSMVAVLSGLRPRLFCWPIFLGLLYVTAADRLAAFSMNKIALAAYAVLLLAPWASADAGVGSEPEGRGERAREAAGEQLELRSRWPIRILQITLILQYLGAGICKLRGDWLESGQVLSLQVQGVFMTDLAAWMVRALPTWIWAGLQHGALAFELAAPLLFASRRLRPLAFVWGVAMHLAIGLMMYRVGFFSLSVVAFYVLFLDADTLRRLIGRAA